MQRLQEFGVSIAFALTTVLGVAPASAQGVGPTPGIPLRNPGTGSEPPAIQAAAPTTGDPTRMAALLSRLRRAADRQVQLGEAANAGAERPETRVYGAELTSQFRAFDGRLEAFASANGLGGADLERVTPGDNVVALRQHVNNLARLANADGESFERAFWTAVATEQAATSDMLAATLDQEPALAGIVADLSALLDQSSQRASVAAAASTTPSSPQNPRRKP